MFKKSPSVLSRAQRLPIAVVLGLFFIAADLAHAQGRLPDCFVLSVGVDDYAYISKLKGDVNDARNTTAAFTAQQGTLFGKVSAHTLADGEATRAGIVQRVEAISKAGKAGDYVVMFMSGHGGVHKESGTWYFCPSDFDSKNLAGTAITDRQLLETADFFVRQGKRVLIIIDACYSGKLRTAAQPYLEKYRNPNGGGLVVMVSSNPDELSNALGDYSAFAKAFADSMNGSADLNGDDKVTLDEIRQFSGKRTNDLLKQAGSAARQNSIIAWSSSIPANTTLALANRPINPPAVAAAAKPSSKRWVGSEDLPGYGELAMTFFSDGRVIMVDAKATSTGTWEATGDEITARFGSVVYTGILNGTQMSGTARSGNTSWAWNVQANSADRPEAAR